MPDYFRGTVIYVSDRLSSQEIFSIPVCPAHPICVVRSWSLISGTVDGTAIGATTASTAEFTTLGATGWAAQVDTLNRTLKVLSP